MFWKLVELKDWKEEATGMLRALVMEDSEEAKTRQEEIKNWRKRKHWHVEIVDVVLLLTNV